MRQYCTILLIGYALLSAIQATSAHTLPRERRQSSPGVMPVDGGTDDRAAIPGISEIQTAIDIAQFLINVGQQVLPAILQSLTPPPNGGGGGTRMGETQLIEAVRRRLGVMADDNRGL